MSLSMRSTSIVSGMSGSSLEGTAEGLEGSTLKLLDRADALPHDFGGLVEREPRDDPQTDRLSLLLTEGLKERQDTVAAEMLYRDVLGRR